MPYNFLWRTYQSYSSLESDGALGLGGVLVLIGLWQVFKKAGIKGWWAIVPIGNLYKLFQISWGNGWWFLTMLIPFVNVVILFATSYKLARAYGKGWGYTLGLVFLAPVFYLMLGFGDSRYLPGAIPRDGPG